MVVKGVADTQFNTWHYGDEPKHNLKGTARTLDEANGEIPLDDGVISRDGWAVLDDSAANVIVEAYEVNGKPNPLGAWVMPRDGASARGGAAYSARSGERHVVANGDGI